MSGTLKPAAAGWDFLSEAERERERGNLTLKFYFHYLQQIESEVSLDAYNGILQKLKIFIDLNVSKSSDFKPEFQCR